MSETEAGVMLAFILAAWCVAWYFIIRAWARRAERFRKASIAVDRGDESNPDVIWARAEIRRVHGDVR